MINELQVESTEIIESIASMGLNKDDLDILAKCLNNVDNFAIKCFTNKVKKISKAKNGKSRKSSTGGFGNKSNELSNEILKDSLSSKNKERDV